MTTTVTLLSDTALIPKNESQSLQRFGDSESWLNHITIGGFLQLQTVLFADYSDSEHNLALPPIHAAREKELEILLSSQTLKLNQMLERSKLAEMERDDSENSRLKTESEAIQAAKKLQAMSERLRVVEKEKKALEDMVQKLEAKLETKMLIAAEKIAQLEHALNQERSKIVASTELNLRKLLDMPCYLGEPETA